MSSAILPAQKVSENEALVTVFLQLSGDNGGEAWMKLSTVELVSDERVVPVAGGQVELAAAEIGGGQRFVARGPVFPERFKFLRLTIEHAALLRQGKKIVLGLVQPVVDLPLPSNFQLLPGESHTLFISWDDKASVEQKALFAAKMKVLSPRLPLLADLAYVSCPDIDTLYLMSTDRNRISGSLAIKGRPSHMVYSVEKRGSMSFLKIRQQ